MPLTTINAEGGNIPTGLFRIEEYDAVFCDYLKPNFGPLLIPGHFDGFMVARELPTGKPQLEPQVSWGDNCVDVETADVILLPFDEE